MSTAIVEHIPDIMKKLEFGVGERLMREWQRRPSSIFPKYSASVTNVATMKWVRGFERAEAVLKQMLDEHIWTNDASRARLYKFLERDKLLDKAAHDFNYLKSQVEEAHQSYINSRQVGFAAKFDDLTAALNRFTFYVVAAGSVKPVDTKAKRHEVLFRRVGIYLRDSYDFDGEQFLGYWNDKTMSASIFNFLSGESVENATLRQWRKERSKGGDFLIFSDYYEHPIDPPTRVQL